MRNLDTNYCWRKWMKNLNGLHGECPEAEYFWKPSLLLRCFGKSCCPSHLVGRDSFLCAGNVDMYGFWLVFLWLFGFFVLMFGVFICLFVFAFCFVCSFFSSFSWGIYMERSYPMFNEEKSTKIKICLEAKTLLLDLTNVWLQFKSGLSVWAFGKESSPWE